MANLIIGLAIPSPSSSYLELGPLTIRYYALSIILGVIAAIYLGSYRIQQVGGSKYLVSDVAVLAVPMGVIGGRIYHVFSTPAPYFGAGGDPVSALYIWQGGLGIWGAISLGFLGAWIAFKRYKRRDKFDLTFAQFADALAPALLIAQAIGRFGNWFNQELFGKPTTLPWALEISPRYRPLGFTRFETFHPTFLYEAIWATFVALLLILITKRMSDKPGALFALYVILYSFGRLFIEQLRIDTAVSVAGFRINTWISLAVILAGIMVLRRLKHVEVGVSQSDFPNSPPKSRE